MLFIGQGLALIALFTTAAIGSITGVQLAGTERVAGWPSTAQLLGGTIAAYIAGRVMNRFGRRIGLSLGYVVGIVGGIIAGSAVIANSFAMFLGGMFLLGAARATSDQSRYAAADVSPAPMRSRAVSIIVFAGTIGAVLGPAITPIAGQLAESLGFDQLAGPWFINAVVMMITLVFVFVFLRPDPRDVARRMNRARPPQTDRRGAAPGPIVPAGVSGSAGARGAHCDGSGANCDGDDHEHHSDSYDPLRSRTGCDQFCDLHAHSGDVWSVARDGLDQRSVGPRADDRHRQFAAYCVVRPCTDESADVAAGRLVVLAGFGLEFLLCCGIGIVDRSVGGERTAPHSRFGRSRRRAASVIGSLSSGELMVSAGYGAANAIGIGVSLAIFVVAVISMRRRMLAVPAS